VSKSITNLKISVSGIRGVVGETLTPRLISAFSASFGQYVGAGPVIIGRDTRSTGLMVEQAVIAGLLSVGCQPILCEILPTPSIQVMVSHLNAVGGIAITASHNPMSWNAMKFINGNGMFLNNIEAREVLDIYNQENIRYIHEEQCRSIKYHHDAFSVHQQRILKHIDCEIIQQKKFKVAIDCANGAGAPYSQDFLEALGCEVVAIHTETDGIFRRKPEPTPDALGKLEEIVKSHHCDIGFAQDPDADRLVIVDNLGNALNENYTLALAVQHITLSDNSPICVNLATSKMIEDICKINGNELRYTKIGEINVSTEMVKCGAKIGGEANGGVIWPIIHPCRDSFGGMALILELLAKQGQSISQIIDTLPKYYFGSIKLPCSSEKSLHVMRLLKKEHAHLQPLLLDGMRLNWKDRWIIIRSSNTEPLLRIQAEADTPEKLAKMLGEFKEKCLDLMK